MLLKLLRSLPLLFLVVVYSLFMTSAHGLVPGLHLSFITCSFFILCTPLPAYFYLLGVWPGAMHAQPSFLATISFWFVVLGGNWASMFFTPGIYNLEVLPPLLYKLLQHRSTMLPTLGVSLSFLFVHWLFSQVENIWVRGILHIFGIVGSIVSIYYLLIIYQVQDNFVVFMAQLNNSAA